ncbi:F-box domain, cyclin-like protein [Cynara cardunculus var. scolymus]|uniref:F-box domain, cyclin-like protein n=1 Tax=Cynara cardunculus var. scolymus TaxID=59895 RepID=A0A103QBI4_CYNCS|nr:F-box domain, cyclin-like protein [Cynara cardunculus var. scolymus]
MLFFLISCFSFILLSKFSFFKTIPSWNLQMGSVSFQSFFKHLLKTSMISLSFPPLDPMKNGVITSKAEKKDGDCLSDLPDLPLECILEKLSPAGLTSMSGVCRSFRAMCTQDHLWEPHLKGKWGKLLMGDSVYKEWQAYIDTKKKKKKQTLVDCSNGKGYFGVLTTGFWWKQNVKESRSSICVPVDSIMAWYLSLENGSFSFPAQVYNRENGNVGFLLSCYDAKVSYDSNTDSFKARYSAHGRPTTEENIGWERLRSPAVDASPYDLHVGGMELLATWNHVMETSFIANAIVVVNTVILEFKQYSPGSRWREVEIDRKDHREVGNETDGFYAGIRKLYNNDEIVIWKGLWPTQPLA